jgi:arylsulfatase A-like enzyme
MMATATCAQEKPNVLYILVDNWGWGDIRIQGGSIPTPRIDGLAREGLRMTNFNVESQCVPTRSAIMTGRLPVRSGTHRVTYGLPYGMAPWEYTLAELFSDAGDNTALFGKWHLGDVEGRLPTNQGFDQWFGVKNTSDEAGYSSTPQFDADVVPQPYIWEGEKGKPSTKV